MHSIIACMVWLFTVSNTVPSEFEIAISSYERLMCVRVENTPDGYTSRRQFIRVESACETHGIVGVDMKERIEKCIKQVVLITSRTLDFVPVMDIKTNVTYRNIHCALCNGIDPSRIKFWHVRLKSATTSSVSFKTVDDIGRVVSENSNTEITVHRPRIELPTLRGLSMANECYFLIKECNVTGVVQKFDVDQAFSCITGSSLDHIFWKGIAFKNFACMRCNGFDFSGYQARDALYDQNWTYSTWIPVERLSMVHTTETESCPDGMFIYEERCVETRCSPLRHLHNGTCKRIQQLLESYSYKLCIRLIPRTHLALEDGYKLVYYLQMELRYLLHDALSFDDFKADSFLYFDNNTIDNHQTDLLYYDWLIKLRVSYQSPEKNLINLISFVKKLSVTVQTNTSSPSTFSAVLRDCKTITPFIHVYIPICLSDLSDSVNGPICEAVAFRNVYKNQSVIGISLHNAVNNYAFYDSSSDISTERNILEMRKCPFAKLSTADLSWKETEVGLRFLQVEFLLPFSDFVYGETVDIVWVCKHIYIQLYNTINATKEVPPPSQASAVHGHQVVTVMHTVITLILILPPKQWYTELTDRRQNA